jgi:hypothetical protein
MFQLKDSIENWKQKLSNSNSFTSSDIEELESHLLEEVDLLKEKELTEEEAFYVASSRLGSVELLSSEFTKINTNSIYLKRIAWFLGGYILISFIQQLIAAFSLLSTSYLYTLNTLYPDQYPYLSLIISVIISTIFLYFLLTPKYQLLSKIQSSFNYLFVFKKLLLMLLFFLLIVMNSLGFALLRSIVMNKIWISVEVYTKISVSETIFVTIWSIILCVTFMVISYKKSRS